ncbi:MAG: ATP synthase F1 subunit delta [Planctomycetota bacterium]|jgi:F-type H+-transporting ATPase subunit delta|nr:ATP synthase F1 subunit delta [Planctomycetota bacterium]
MATTQHIDEIASVYATSLLEVCDKQGGVALAESCSAELSALAEMIRADKRFAEFLKTPIIGAAARRASIDRIVKGKVSDLVHRFVMVIAAHGRAGRLADISDAFDGLLQARLGRVEVDMYTVTGQAAPDVVATVKGGVKEAFGKEAVIHQYADPNMIGGVKLRIGDQLIDGSVETQLRNMRDAVAARGTGAMRSRLGDFLA